MAQRMPQPISYEDWRASSGDGTMSEWVDGEVVTFMPPKQIHFELTNLLIGVLLLIVTRRKLGRVFHAPVEMRLPRSAREPDLLFLANANLGRLDGARVNGPADLAIEVVSDDSVIRDRMVKFAEYEAAGVREYWVIDPRDGRQHVEAWLLGEDGRYREIDPGADGRIASVTIPGFVFDLRWMSPEHLADPGLAMAETSAMLDAGWPGWTAGGVIPSPARTGGPGPTSTACRSGLTAR